MVGCNKFLTLGFGCEQEEVLEFQRGTFSPVFSRVDLCVNVIDLHIMREHPNYWDLRRTVTIRQILHGVSCKGVVVLCKTCEAVNGESKCVVFFFLCVVNLRGGVVSTSLYNVFELKGLCYKV